MSIPAKRNAETLYVALADGLSIKSKTMDVVLEDFRTSLLFSSTLNT